MQKKYRQDLRFPFVGCTNHSMWNYSVEIETISYGNLIFIITITKYQIPSQHKNKLLAFMRIIGDCRGIYLRRKSEHKGIDAAVKAFMNNGFINISHLCQVADDLFSFAFSDDGKTVFGLFIVEKIGNMHV